MKKILLLLAGILMAGSLAACGPTEVNRSQMPETSEAPETSTRSPEEKSNMAADRTPLPNQVAETDMVFIYHGNSDGTKLERMQTFTDEMTDQFVLDKLIEYGVLEEGTEINSFETEGNIGIGPGMEEGTAEKTGERIGTLDLSQVPEVSGNDETVMLNSIAATFMENYQLDKLKLLVNGDNYKSAQIVQGDDDYLEFDMDYVDTYEEYDEYAE